MGNGETDIPARPAAAEHTAPANGDDPDRAERLQETALPRPKKGLDAELDRVGAPNERTEITLVWGDRFWHLADLKYQNRFPIDAIYEANNIDPKIRKNNGNWEIIDPIYFAGKTYVLPAESEVPALREKFWARHGLKPPYTSDFPPIAATSSPTPPRDAVSGTPPPDAASGTPPPIPGGGATKPADGGKLPEAIPPNPPEATPPAVTPPNPPEATPPAVTPPNPPEATPPAVTPPSPPEAEPIPQNPPDSTPPPGNTPPDQSNQPADNSAPAVPAPDAAAQAALQQKALMDVAGSVQAMHDQAAYELDQESKKQGILGSLFDSAKQSVGTSAHGHDWYHPAALWSHVFDSDSSSNTAHKLVDDEQKVIDQLKNAAQDNDAAEFGRVYQQLTGKPYVETAPNHELVSVVAVKSFENSQAGGVEGITDIASAMMSVVAIRSMKGKVTESIFKSVGLGALVGGTTKLTLKGIDGRYADPTRDFTVGAIWGATAPLGEIGGSAVSKYVGGRLGLTVTGDLLTARIETQGTGMGIRWLSAAAKSGTSGSVFGAVDAPTRDILQARDEGRSVTAFELFGKTLQGATFGFLGGTVFGFTLDGLADGFKRLRPSAVRAPVPEEINGVKVPASGSVGLDDAAKILKQDPAAFLEKAANNPYGAVDDAIALYEQTGLNIRKSAAPGAVDIPPQFTEALGTVQTVDQLTPEVGTSLSGKAKIVRSADEFLAESSQAVDESLARVTSDEKYREVVRLKTEQQGAQAAQQFEDEFGKSFRKDLKIGVSVERVKAPGLGNEEALSTVGAQTEQSYLKKSADFFKDMTDPQQRARLNQLVDDIFAKFNPEVITKPQLQEILAGFNEEERKIAVAILEESMVNSSDIAVRARMQSIRSQLQSATGSSSPNVYTLSPDSSGNMLGYLYRKSNSMSMSIQNIDAIASSGAVPDTIVLFDDLSTATITAQQREILAKAHRVVVVDLGGFERGLNILDFAQGPQAVASKLRTLVPEALSASQQSRSLLPIAAARDTLTGSVDRVAQQLGPNVTVIRPQGNFSLANVPDAAALAEMEPVDAILARVNAPKSSKEEIASFLSKYAGEDRELAARMLADGAVHNSFPAMVRKAIAAHANITEMLSRSGMSTDDLLMVVDKDPGGSTHLITYLYGRVNGLAPGNYISSRGLNERIQQGLAGGSAVAYFDDTIYSGSQMSGMLESSISSFMPFKRVIVGGLGAYEKGITAISATHLARIGKVGIVSPQTHYPFYASQHPFFSSLDAGAQSRVRSIGGNTGFGDIQGSLIWSYMYPDNNLDFFGHSFAGSVLQLPGP